MFYPAPGRCEIARPDQGHALEERGLQRFPAQRRPRGETLLRAWICRPEVRSEADDEKEGDQAYYDKHARLQEPFESRDGAKARGAVCSDIDDEAGVSVLH